LNVAADKFFVSLDSYLEKMISFFTAKAAKNKTLRKEMETFEQVSVLKFCWLTGFVMSMW